MGHLTTAIADVQLPPQRAPGRLGPDKPSSIGLDVGLGCASPFVVVASKLSVRDIIGPVIRLETGSGATYWSAGLELGSGTGAVATVLAILAAMIAMAACC